MERIVQDLTWTFGIGGMAGLSDEQLKLVRWRLEHGETVQGRLSFLHLLGRQILCFLLISRSPIL